jgi:hypothetical protein
MNFADSRSESIGKRLHISVDENCKCVYLWQQLQQQQSWHCSCWPVRLTWSVTCSDVCCDVCAPPLLLLSALAHTVCPLLSAICTQYAEVFVDK